MMLYLVPNRSETVKLITKDDIWDMNKEFLKLTISDNKFKVMLAKKRG